MLLGNDSCRSVRRRNASVRRRAHHPLERQDGALGAAEHVRIDAAGYRIKRQRHGELREEDNVGVGRVCGGFRDERVVAFVDHPLEARLKRLRRKIPRF